MGAARHSRQPHQRHRGNWNMARQRYCRRLARYRNTLRVSADPVAKPAAHTRAESRGSRPSNGDAGERRTVCWREMDSNFWYRGTKAVDFRSIPGIAGVSAGALKPVHYEATVHSRRDGSPQLPHPRGKPRLHADDVGALQRAVRHPSGRHGACARPAGPRFHPAPGWRGSGTSTGLNISSKDIMLTARRC